MLDWINHADILISNFKPGSASKLGFDYDTMQKQNPRLIYASITAYGEEDPRPGFDLIIQAETGWMFMNGEEKGLPVKLPVALMDILVAHQIKEGILLALIHRFKTGKGAKVFASIFDAGISALKNQATNWLNVGTIPLRIGTRHPNISPYGDLVRTQDNQLFVLAPGTEKHFRDLCNCIHLVDLPKELKFATNKNRIQYRDELYLHISNAVKQIDAKTFKARCLAKQVPIAEIRNMQEVFTDPKAKSSVQTEIKENGEKAYSVKEIAFSIQVSDY